MVTELNHSWKDHTSIHRTPLPPPTLPIPHHLLSSLFVTYKYLGMETNYGIFVITMYCVVFSFCQKQIPGKGRCWLFGGGTKIWSFFTCSKSFLADRRDLRLFSFYWCFKGLVNIRNSANYGSVFYIFEFLPIRIGSLSIFLPVRVGSLSELLPIMGGSQVTQSAELRMIWKIQAYFLENVIFFQLSIFKHVSVNLFKMYWNNRR